MSYVVSDLDWVLKLRLLKEYRFSNEWVKSVFEIQAYSDWGELEGGVLLLQYSKSPVGVDYIANNIMTCKWGFVIVVVRFESVKWCHHFVRWFHIASRKNARPRTKSDGITPKLYPYLCYRFSPPRGSWHLAKPFLRNLSDFFERHECLFHQRFLLKLWHYRKWVGFKTSELADVCDEELLWAVERSCALSSITKAPPNDGALLNRG
jgi:hypothetical protein